MGSGRGFTPQNRGFHLRTQADNSIIERWPIVCGAGLVIVTLKDSNCPPQRPIRNAPLPVVQVEGFGSGVGIRGLVTLRAGRSYA